MMKEIVQNQKDEMLISNPEKLNEKRSIFTKSSSDKCIFVSDFDYTFSLRFLNHIQLYSSYCFLENSLLINEKNPNFKNQLHEQSLKYEQYETDTSIDFEFRKNIIKEWFEKALDLYTAQHITKKDFIEVIREAADKEKFYFRKGLKSFFEKLLSLNIPIIIISGGVKEIIEILLQDFLGDIYTEMIAKHLLTILANEFTYDNQDKVNGYIQPVIYTFNKGKFVKDAISVHYPHLKLENIFIMGDHLNDYDSIKEIEEVKDKKNIIGIGFININPDGEIKEKTEKTIEEFKNVFDVNILSNGGFEYVNNLLDSLYKS